MGSGTKTIHLHLLLYTFYAVSQLLWTRSCKTFLLFSTTAVVLAVAPQQLDSISVVCVLTRVRLCLFMLCECRHAWICMCECVSTCERVYVSECVCSVGPWSLSMDLNPPSPALFAQDMPQEAKTTVHVCPCCEPLLIHPTAAFFHTQTLCLSVFLYIHPMESVGSRHARHFLRTHPSGVGLKCQQISDRQIPTTSYIM